MALKRKNAYVALAVGISLLAVVLCLLLIGYGQIKKAQNKLERDRDAAKVQVLVAVDPCADLVERVGGDDVRVSVLTPEGKSPETFAPTPSQLADVASTELFFLVGLPVEKRLLDSVQSIAPDAVLVDLCEGVELIAERAPDSASSDPHLWTSPSVARKMVAKIAEELAKIDPTRGSYIENAGALDAELEALQQEVGAALRPYKGRFFLVFHPAYGYYAREFGLEQRAIETDGKAPKPRELEALVDAARSANVRALILQPEFNRSAAEVIADSFGADLSTFADVQLLPIFGR